MKLARIAAVKYSLLVQLNSQLKYIDKSNIKLTMIASKKDDISETEKLLEELPHSSFIPINICRKISLFNDIKSLSKLIYTFKVNKYDIVHSTTPKAGLLTAIAGITTGVKVRLHTFTGQPWVTEKGLKKIILMYCDKIISRLNTKCYADSSSQRDFLIKKNIINKDKIDVLHSGSLAGIDLARFNEKNYPDGVKSSFKKMFNIPADDLIITFIGRVTKDKGVRELICSFESIIKTNDNISLLIVGPKEKDEIDYFSEISSRMKSKIYYHEFTSRPEDFLAISNIFCLPSYREGFGTVIIEAAALGVPSVATNIYGISDAIVDGETGLLVPPMNSKLLTIALLKLIGDKSLRKKMGVAAKNRVISSFNSEVISKALIDDYYSMLP